jgi:hypothetical protein
MLIWAISASVVSAYLYNQNITMQRKLVSLESKFEKLETYYTVYLIINYSNGTVDKFKLYVQDGVNNTVFDILQAVAKIDYTYYESFGDVMIDAINGLQNNPSESYYWLFYVNGEFSTTGAMNTLLFDGDKVLWVYTKI